MKIRTALISVVVSGALIGGVIYAAYYTVGLGKKSSVQVVPVRYVYSDIGYYYDEDSMYGTVTSRVAQNITLESDYSIEEIYVSAGDEVTEGTPLFSYDMTSKEIELESYEIELQSLELQLKKNQKDLAKYTGTTATASLENTSTVLTSSADIVSDESETGTENTAAVSEDGSAAGSDSGTENDEILDGDATGSTGTEGDSSDASGAAKTDNTGSESTGFIEGIEEVTDEMRLSYVSNFESVMTALQDYISSCDGDLSNLSGYTSGDIAIIEEYLFGSVTVSYPAISYYRSNLAGSTTSYMTNSYGETIEVTDYPLLEEVTALLSADQLTALQSAADLLDTYHALYVDLLIHALTVSDGDTTAAVEEARAAYEYLSGNAMKQVTQLSVLESYEAQNVDSLIQAAADLAESQDEAALQNAVTAARTAYDSLSTGAQSQVTLLSVLKLLEGQLTAETESESESETQTESETEAEDVNIAARISAFLLMADEIFSESAAPTAADYQNAIAFYQMYLAAAQAEIEGVDPTMEGYTLSGETTAYLDGLGTEGAMTAAELASEYQNLCLTYVKALVAALDSQTMTAEELSAAQAAYDQLGTAWQILVDDETPSVSDCLIAYDMILRTQALDPASEDFTTQLSALYTDYLALTDTQKELIWNLDTLVELLEQYGFLTAETEAETETETETELLWDDSYDSYGDSEESMTSEERQEAIATLEQAIKECELDIREAELNVEKTQREVDKKVVKATLDGTVVSIGDEDGNSEEDYFATITNTTGLYAKGWISELALDTVNVGDTISGVSDYGDTFTAVIKEISEYPDPSGSGYVFSGNSNASYYAFYALIEDSEGIEEGYAELTLSDAYADTSDSIYLEAWFVRKDSTGNSYVYVEGDDGTLEMRYVTTGQSSSEYFVEIKSGLSMSDYIAFPYGDNVYEGAPTEEVDELTDAYES